MTDPTFAIISAIYNVDRYLSQYFSSLDAQTYPHSQFRVILVDDGSVDGSGESCDRWAASTDLDVRVVHQENAGQGAARNAGLDALDAEPAIDWVTFVDPDDFLAETYFERLAGFVEEHPSAVLLSGHQTEYHEDDPSRPDRHPLRFRYAGGDQLVDLARFPRFFQMNIAAAALRYSAFADGSLRFDTRVRPNFEDGHVIAKYLIDVDRPLVGFVDSAVYWYRKRSDGTSTLQTAHADPRRYTDVIQYGYLDALRHAKERLGVVPEWLQHEIVYELSWTYRSEDAMFGGTATLDASTAQRFHELVSACRSFIDDYVIDGFNIVRTGTAPREALLHGYDEKPWHWDRIYVGSPDVEKGLVQLIYHFTGSAPREEIFIRGRKVQPRFSKTRDFVYLRKALVHERVLWVSAHGDLSVRLNGEAVPIGRSWPHPQGYTMRAPQLARLRPGQARGASLSRRTKSKGGSRRAASAEQKRVLRARKLANSAPVKRAFGDAWLLMDRSHNSHDNAEHLFKYLRKHRRDINAWFVVKRGTEDWKRLRAEGYKRLVPHGSLLWMALCLNAEHIVSSHADAYVYNPFHLEEGWRWRFTFLQHGVTKDDISRWLNSKRIDAIVASTSQEFASIAGNGSGYKFSTREVRLTGMPRFDRLNALASSVDDADGARPIVFMPTWRQYLAGPTVPGTGERGVNERFVDSEFAQRWRELLGSPDIKTAADRAGSRVLFMPHPNLENYIESFQVPYFVERATYSSRDVQEVIASAALVVTDYSSIAFDAAFARRPVIYYQFDRAKVFGGGHIVRPGYFDYRADGFGPVATTHDEVVAEIVRQCAVGGSVQEKYRSRADRAFTAPRSGACRRVVEMIESISRPLSRRESLRPVLTPEAPPIVHGA